MLKSAMALILVLDSTAALAQFSILDDYNSNPGSYAVDESAQGPVGQHDPGLGLEQHLATSCYKAETVLGFSG